MIYRVTLNGKIYEVEVADGEAVLLDTYEASLFFLRRPSRRRRHRAGPAWLPARWSRPRCPAIFCRSQ